jgi:PAS domain S-box-containing protein
MPSIAADVSRSKERRQGSLRRLIEWLLNPEHFHFKLLAGSSAGVLVIVLVAIACAVATFTKQQRERMRARTITIVRLTSVIENDIAGIENAYRGHLLSKNWDGAETLQRLKTLFSKDCETLAGALGDQKESQRVIALRNKVRAWLSNAMEGNAPFKSETALAAPTLVEGQDILRTIQREEQIKLNQRMGSQEWATQSTQILSFIPRLECAVYEMQKEKRGYLLTGDPAFLDNYKRATNDFYTFQGYLSVLLADQPEQVARLGRIRDGLERWIAISAMPEINARRVAGSSTGLGLKPRSRALMDGIRREIERFERDQLEIYEIRSAAAARQRIFVAGLVNVFCIVAAGMMIACAGYNFVLYRRQLKKLDGADARIRSVVDHIFDGMMTINDKGAVTSMNPAAQRMFGYQGDEYRHVPFTRLVPTYFKRQEDGSLLACDWAQLAQRSGGTTLALAMTRTKTSFPVELSLNEMMIERERSFVAMIRDVTERKRFEEEVAAEKNRLAVTLASIGDGVITTDLHGNIVICNKASETITGWTAAEACGRPLRSVFAVSAHDPQRPPTPSPAGYRSEAEAILQTLPQQATLTARDGTARVIEQVASPIRDAQEKISGVVLVFRDITERQRDEAERRKTEALEQLGLLAGGIAHDFNNLLTAIVGNISLLSMLLPPDHNLRSRLEDATNASLRARDLAQQLLTFARGGAPIKKTASVADLVQETVRFSLRGSDIRSDCTIQSELWAAEFDPGQLSQVIANLVVNADQAMPNGGTLHVSCDNFSHRPETGLEIVDLPPGDYIRIQVRDEGTGIPPEALKRIFDPYFTTKAKGNGLGLATAYSVMKNHKGLITVESEMHCGSTFTVFLPALSKPVAAEPVTLLDQPMHGSGRVLIVDDEEAIRMLVEFTLTEFGYEVSGAETAVCGIEMYRQALASGKRFDLVILDLTLPGGMGGKEAMKHLIEIDPMVNAIVSSGYAMDATMSRYEDFGFRGMIAKPYQAAELGRKVRAMIDANGDQPAPSCELQHAC